MRFARLVGNNRGIALITVLLVSLAVSSMAIAASLLTLNGSLIRRFSERSAVADQAALSGLEEALSAVQANPDTVPATDFVTLEDGVPALDAAGTPIPGVSRWTYVGPSGDGVRASIISLARAQGGVVALRRMELAAESYANYGMLIDNDPTGQGFRPTDRMFGPVHFNTGMTVLAPTGADTATFWQKASSTGSIAGIGNGIFKEGYAESADPISFPSLSDFDPLREAAIDADLRFSTPIGNPDGATTRLEFIAVDMDGDPGTDDVEGFFRVYTNSTMSFTVGWQVGLDGPVSTPNCGVLVGTPPNTTFERAGDGLSVTEAQDSVDANRFRCFLGGDPRFNDNQAFDPNPTGPMLGGSWLQWPGPAVPGLSTVRPEDWAYLYPYTPGVNPNSTGVIFVDGEIAVSGVVAGKVTVVATDDIVIVDDLTQYTDPGAAECDRDVMGLIAGDDIVISDNTVMTPQRRDGGSTYHTMGHSKDEYIHAVMLSLDELRVQAATLGPGASHNGGAGAEPCEGIPYGRGCLYLTGSILAGTRGLFGQSGQGFLLRSSFNTCVETQAPPHFPHTNEYRKERVYELSPADFDPADWYDQYQL